MAAQIRRRSWDTTPGEALRSPRNQDYMVHHVSGRPRVLLVLERLYAHMIRHRGVHFCPFNEIADDLARRHPRRKAAAR
jgi:hypothetical protein